MNSCTLDSAGGEKSSTHLVEGQRVVEEQVPSDQSDAKLKMTKHVIAAGERVREAATHRRMKFRQQPKG